MRAGIFDELAQSQHDGGLREEFAENIDLVAQLFCGKRLDKTLRSAGRRAIEFCNLCGGGARQTQSLAFGGDLACQTDGKRFCGIDAAPGKKQIADHAVADVALESRNAAEAGDESQTQLGKTEAS